MPEIITSKDYLMYIDDVTPTANTLRPATQANYRLVACWTSNGFSQTTAGNEFTNKCSGGNAESAPGTKSSTMTGSGQAFSLTEDEEEAQANFETILNLSNADTGNVHFVKIVRPASAGIPAVWREAKAWISDYSETGDDIAPLTFDATWTVTGRVFTSALPVTP